jgi:hypothetical protein
VFLLLIFTLDLPNSLLIAEAFILKYPDYGTDYGLPAINKSVEDGIKPGLFDMTVRQIAILS